MENVFVTTDKVNKTVCQHNSSLIKVYNGSSTCANTCR